MQRKKIFARVFDPDGELVATWYSIDFKRYTKELNGGLGECIVRLGFPFDYDSADLAEGNVVELVVSDGDTAAAEGTDTFGKVVYRGYIVDIERSVTGDSEGPTIFLVGFHTLLSMDVLKNGANTTLYTKPSDGLTTASGDLGAVDIAVVVRALIDRYRAESAVPRIFYDTPDIPTTSTDITYTFQQMTYRSALDKLKAMAPANVYWYVNADGRLTFDDKPSTPTHRFIFGQHFSEARVMKSLSKVRNVLLLYNGQPDGSGDIYQAYEDAGSIAKYGRRVELATDIGITDTDAADAIGAKFLAESAQPDVRVVARIFDNNNEEGKGYDIESIEPGQTCDFLGFSEKLTDIFRGNALITRVVYTLDYADVEVELVRAGLLDFQEKQQRDLMQLSGGSLGIPESYT